MRNTHSLVALVLVLAAHVPALAAPRQGSPSSARKDSLSHFQKGEGYYRQGEFGRAVEAYRRALALQRDPAFLFNIAQCYRQLADHRRAIFFYRLYLAEASHPANRDAVLAMIHTLEERHSRELQRQGRLSVSSTPEGASIRLDDQGSRPVGRTPKLLTLTSGDYLIILEHPGFRPISRRVTVAARGTSELTLRLEPLPTGSGRPTGTSPVDGRPAQARAALARQWWLWTGAGLTLALVASSVGTGIAAKQRHDDWLDRYSVDDRRIGRSLSIASDVQWSLAAAGAISVTVAALLYQRRLRRERHTIVAPACTAGACAVWVRGLF